MVEITITQSNMINLIGSFLFLAVAVLFLYQTRRKHRNTPLLTFGFFLAFIGQFFNTITLIFWESEFITDTLSITLQIIFIAAFNLIILFFWIFLERTNAPTVDTRFLLVVTVLGSAYVVARIVLIALIDEPAINLDGIILWGNFIFVSLINVLAFRSSYIQYKVYEATDRENLAGYQLLGLGLITVWAALGFITTVVELVSFQMGITSLSSIILQIFDLTAIIGDILYFTGLGLFVLTILVNPDYVHRMPLNIQDIIVIANAGFAVYGIGKNAEEKSLDEQLLAGFLTAANNFVNEMKPDYDSEKLRFLRSSNRILRMHFGETIGVCIVSNRENYFLIQSIQNLVEFIETQNPEEHIMVGEFFEDEEVRSWLKQFFPFLGIDQMDSY